MRDDPCVNHTSHCDLCTPGLRNYVRVHIGDTQSTSPRVAVCPVHDVAGPLGALPIALQIATGARSA